MKSLLCSLSLITLLIFAGGSLAEEAATGVEASAPPAAADNLPQPSRAPEAEATCPTSPALPFMTNPMAEAAPARCPYFQCVNSCVCPSGCVSSCVSIQWCECECDCP